MQDGQYILFGTRNHAAVCSSANYGKSWNLNVSENFPLPERASGMFTVGISSSGQHQTVVATNFQFSVWFLVSDDAGSTWNATYHQDGPTAPSCHTVVLSDSGQYQAIACQNALFLSSNWGTNWTSAALPYTHFVDGGLAMSSDGQYLSLGAGTMNSSAVLVSLDRGLTWIAGLSFDDPTVTIAGVAMSSNGLFHIAAIVPGTDVYSGGLFSSLDYGKSWHNISKFISAQNFTWTGIAMCATGQYVTVVGELGSPFLVSHDYGHSWDLVMPAGVSAVNAHAVSVSQSGQYQAAGLDGVGLVISQDFGQTWNAAVTSLGQIVSISMT